MYGEKPILIHLPLAQRESYNHNVLMITIRLTMQDSYKALVKQSNLQSNVLHHTKQFHSKSQLRTSQFTSLSQFTTLTLITITVHSQYWKLNSLAQALQSTRSLTPLYPKESLCLVIMQIRISTKQLLKWQRIILVKGSRAGQLLLRTWRSLASHQSRLYWNLMTLGSK